MLPERATSRLLSTRVPWKAEDVSPPVDVCLAIGRHRPACRVIATAFLVVSSACSPGRPPVPAGVIPEPKPVLPSEEQYGHQILSKLSEEYPLDMGHPRAGEVLEVVDKLSRAAKANSDPWHVYIFRDAQFKNAAATRGNHVFIWTGLLETTKNEAELAAIIGHEISHVLARHTDPDPNEELKKILVGVGALAAGVAVSAATQNSALSSNIGDITSSVTQSVGEGFLVNPYSRDRELEADQIGLFLMADAGYDPRAAIEFWKRAQMDPAFSSSLEFLSTHPPAGDRLANLERLLPAAEKRYRGELPRGQAIEPTSQGVPQGQITADPRAPVGANAERREREAREAVPPSRPGEDSFAVNPDDVRRDRRQQVDLSPGGTTFTPGDLREPSSTTAAGTEFETTQPVELRAKPDRYARAVGEFDRGAPLRGRPVQGGWIEVTVPDHGYIPESAVRRR